MALTEYYVDPSIAGDSGSGTVGDPYGDLQYALNTVTRDSTNGDRFNIKAGSDEVLGAALSLATYGTPAANAPLVFQGYTSSQGDGGIGGISGNGSYSIISSTALDYISFVHLKLHNSGSNDIVILDNNITFIGCEITNTSGDGIEVDSNCNILHCHIHNCGGSGVEVFSDSTIADCFFKNDGSNDFAQAIRLVGRENFILRNIISIDGSSNGIDYTNNSGATTTNNSIYSNGGTGYGIRASGGANYDFVISNNIVEGFSGTGGVGIETHSISVAALIVGNRYYNNTTNESFNGTIVYSTDNSALGSSPFTNPGSDDFTVGTGVKAEGFPSAFNGGSTNQYLDTGAAQRPESGVPAAPSSLIILVLSISWIIAMLWGLA